MSYSTLFFMLGSNVNESCQSKIGPKFFIQFLQWSNWRQLIVGNCRLRFWNQRDHRVLFDTNTNTMGNGELLNDGITDPIKKGNINLIAAVNSKLSHCSSNALSYLPISELEVFGINFFHKWNNQFVLDLSPWSKWPVNKDNPLRSAKEI